MELMIDGRRAYAYTGGRTFDPRLPAVVFIHGGEQDHSVWGLQSRYLAHHGRGVLAVDLPGHGRSAGPALAGIGEMADWIAAVLDWAGVRTAALVGHSMGSLVAFDCAGRHPQRVSRIALLAFAYPMRVSRVLLDAAKNDEPAAHAMINAWSHAAYAHYPSNPGPGFWVRGENLRLMQRQKPGVVHADFAACNDYAGGRGLASRITCPALFLLAERDVMTPARGAKEIAAEIPGAKTVTLRGCGHNLMGEKPDEVLDLLRDFLR
jgi:pimeloyl-ACP methyl ester carboxylesterase